MNWIDKVEVFSSTACDLLYGLFRLNNNDRFHELFESSLYKGKCEPNRDIQNRVSETKSILTPDILEKLEEFFDWETFLWNVLSSGYYAQLPQKCKTAN
ncbi:hypothetical protein [Mesotoga sp. B105.6.4]|uniref:hypothetical protein n=1 Tax=Mesotoga sp. B105.6.4 TaxID=1582224 RepID=UPI0021553593|nr:hypothetical protein [Mesotoga sp. B105.6.4]